MADKFEGAVVPVEPGFLNYVLREPLGVVGQIVPWNFPLMFTSWKMGPALAAGNSVVMKPAELTPLASLQDRGADARGRLSAPASSTSCPGYGNIAGQYLAEHPERRTRSPSPARPRPAGSIVQASAGNLKQVQLELGGKGANIVFDDADLAAAVNGTAFAIFHNQGQACIAGSRLLLHESIADEFLDRFLALAGSIRLGDPLDPATEMGPLTSLAASRPRACLTVEVARERGRRDPARRQGARRSRELAKGCYVEPTVVRAQPERSRLPGGGLRALRDGDRPSSDEAEVARDRQRHRLRPRRRPVDRATCQRAHRVARQMHAGMVWINCYKRVNPGSPFGGVGQSGYGREMGFEAMREYTSAKVGVGQRRRQASAVLSAVTRLRWR